MILYAKGHNNLCPLCNKWCINHQNYYRDWYVVH